jgi:hypothetical protein
MPTRAALQARAAAAGRLLGAGARLRVRPWFAAGYLLADRVGRSTHVTELDSLWHTAGEWGAALPGWEPGSGDPVTVQVDLIPDPDALAVWLAAVAHLGRPDGLELRLSDPARDRTVVARLAPGTVDVDLAPCALGVDLAPCAVGVDLAPRAVAVDLAPCAVTAGTAPAGDSASVRGRGAAEAARHLSRHLAGELSSR